MISIKRYDEQGNLVSTRAVTWTRDYSGNVTHEVLSNNTQELEYLYNASGQITQMNDITNSGTLEVQYNQDGSIDRTIWQFTLCDRFTYDGEQMVTHWDEYDGPCPDVDPSSSTTREHVFTVPCSAEYVGQLVGLPFNGVHACPRGVPSGARLIAVDADADIFVRGQVRFFGAVVSAAKVLCAGGSVRAGQQADALIDGLGIRADRPHGTLFLGRAVGCAQAVADPGNTAAPRAIFVSRAAGLHKCLRRDLRRIAGDAISTGG